MYAGRQLAVNAMIENLSESEGAAVVYSTPDGQVVDAQLAMRSLGNERWTANLPEATEGLQQDVTYRISAGDAVAGPFRVNVLPSPSIVVNQLDYDYPEAAVGLFRLYQWCLNCIRKGDFRSAKDTLQELRTAWATVETNQNPIPGQNPGASADGVAYAQAV